MDQYLNLAKRVLDEGEMVHNSRTGIGCLTVINADLEYDVENGVFPLVTTRKAFYKSAIAELLGYLRGYSSAADFRAVGTPTWDANANENKAWLANPHRKGVDDMGQAYRFRKKVHYVKLKENFRKKPSEQKLPTFDKIPCDFTSNKHELVGKVFSSNNFGSFTVVKESTDKEKLFTIQFNQTGFIKTNLRKAEIERGEVKDPYFPSVFGVACEGEPDKSDEDYTTLKKVWNNLIKRCYVENIRWYSEDGKFVSDDWLVFANFMRDAKTIPNWYLKKVFPDEYSLDKDLYNSNYYSKETCRWSTASEQTMNKRDVRTFSLVKDDLETIVKSNKLLTTFLNETTHFCNNLSNLSEGDVFTHSSGYTVKVLPYNSFCYIESDQLKSLYAKLVCGVDDRGLIISAWHEELEPYTCLRPCMYSHHFSIHKDKLYLNSTQRSCDAPLGLVANMVQAYVLLALMSQITGIKPGKVYHKIVNVHIYENQIELMKEQVKRLPYSPPKFEINPNIKTLKDVETWVTTNDFTVTDYQHHEPIKYPFAV